MKGAASPLGSSRGRARAAPAALGLGLALGLSLLLALTLGSEPTSLVRAASDPSSLDRLLVFEIRLPRALLGALAGAGLAAVGATFQALLKNPLADPYVLGVSGGAALGATSAIALGLSGGAWLGAALLPAAAFAGGLVATAVVYATAAGASGEGGRASGASVLLAGVMVNAIAASLITLLKALAPPSRASQLLRWLTGFVDLPSWPGLGAALAYVGIGCAVLVADAGRLNLLSLGDESARSLGVDVRALERRLFLASSFVVGAIVSLTGLIGFVGLVVPHAVRRLVGPDARAVVPLSMLAGAAMLLLCDLASRLAFRRFGTEPPVGAVTALVGGPAFLIILRRARR